MKIELKEELTEKMHEEFTIDRDTEIKLKAGTVWDVAGFDCTDEDLEGWCEQYGITIQQAKKWKNHWWKLHQQTEQLKKQRNK